MLASAWLVVVFAAVMFLTVASPAGGWLWAALCFLPGLVASARMGGIRRWRDTLLLALGVALAAGTWAYAVAPPDHGRIDRVAQNVGVPEGWELAEVSEHGNTWCFKGCPEVTYFYAAPGAPAETVAALDTILKDRGWTGGVEDRSYGGEPSEYDPEARAAWIRGRWRVDLRVPSVALRHGSDQEVAVRGLTPVEITFSAVR
jgi:hypothetical protein